MSPNFAVHVAMCDQQVFVQSEVQAEQHQNCKRHSLHSTARSLHICQTQEKLTHGASINVI